MNKELSYPRIKHIIATITDLRTQAMVAVQYALAARAGELVRYTHKDGESPGLLKSEIVKQKGLYVLKIPNFKNSRQPFKKPYISPKEAFLFEPFKAWLEVCGEQVFDVKISRYRSLVSAALPDGFATHSLRHSRATHLAEVFGFNAFEIKAFLGHARLDTSAIYVTADLTRTHNKLEEALE
jgi:integrase